jgi:hypothetical protein
MIRILRGQWPNFSQGKDGAVEPEEFFAGGTALPGGPPAGKIDLLTAVVQETAGVFGVGGGGLMTLSPARGTSGPSKRRSRRSAAPGRPDERGEKVPGIDIAIHILAMSVPDTFLI